MSAAMPISSRLRLVLPLMLLGLLAFAPAARAASSAPAVDRVEVYKERHEMRLLHNGKVVKSYRVSLGRESGKKVQAGDNRTPEGIYTIDFVKRHSVYHRALHISYPNEDDYQQAASRGESPGGNIMIHGLAEETPIALRLHKAFDWTRGCIALTNREIDEVARLVKPGTPIAIYP